MLLLIQKKKILKKQVIFFLINYFFLYLDSGLIIFKSPLSVNLCLKDKINHLILGRYIFCKKYKERNKNKSKIFSGKNFYSIYDSNSLKLEIKNKYNNKNNLRNLNDIYYYNNSFQEPTYLNPIQIQKSNLFIYRKETNNKSDNDKIIHENNNNNNVNIFKNDSLNQSSLNFNLLFKQNFQESDFQQEDDNSKKTEKILLKENETFNCNNHLHLLYSNLINKKSFNKNNDNKYEKENNKNNDNKYEKENNKNDSQLFQNLFNNYLKNPKKNENNHYKLYDVNGEEISKLSSYQNITKVPLFKSDSDKSEKDSNSDSNKSLNQKLNISNKLNLNNSNNIKSLSTYSLSKNCSNNNSNNNSNSNLNCSDYCSIKISGFNSDNQSSKFSNISCNDLCLKHSKSFNNLIKKKKSQKFKKSKSAVFKNIEILLI